MVLLYINASKDADGMAISVDPEQTATLFAQTCMSENFILAYCSYNSFT